MQICPKQCISFTEDLEGFNYPQVDAQHCINCGLCDDVCPVINQAPPREVKSIYAGKNHNEQIRKESSSGGLFTPIAEQTISNGGVVFGAKFNEKWEVEHGYTESIEGLAQFRGSKYVQSKIGNSYNDVKSFLDVGREVLFSGTPCQVAGLRLFLRKRYDNLLLVDFFCHGVPSPMVWRRYLQGVVCSQGSGKSSDGSTFSMNKTTPIKDICFRDKTNGWKKYGFVVWGESSQGDKDKISLSGIHSSRRDANLIEWHRDNIYMKGFLADIYLRPSCYSCPSKSLKSGSDMTIADFWGVQNRLPEFDDDKGVSLVLCNSKEGEDRYKEIDACSVEVDHSCLQRILYNSVRHNPKREIGRAHV